MLWSMIMLLQKNKCSGVFSQRLFARCLMHTLNLMRSCLPMTNVRSEFLSSGLMSGCENKSRIDMSGKQENLSSTG
jgi:hypothetical protein